MLEIPSPLRRLFARPVSSPTTPSAVQSKSLTRVPLALAATILLTLSSGPALSEAPKIKREWRQMSTPNFVLFGDASARQMRQVGDSLEGLRTYLSTMSNSSIDAPVPSYIYVFKDQKSFAPYRPLQPNGEPIEASGYFSRRQHANYIAIDGSRRDAMIGTTLHEYVHFYLSYRTPDIPLWLNEGMAELYSTFEVEGDRVHIGKIIPYHLQWLQQNKMIPLLELFAVDLESPQYNESDRRGVFYAQSWALLHYMMIQQPQGPQILRRFMKLQEELPLADAFAQAFGTTPKELRRELRRYVRSQLFTYRQAELAIDDLREQFTFRDMTQSEALARLGEALATQGRQQEAREHLQAALTINADEIRAHVGLGLLETRPEGDLDVAVDRFSAARRLAPTDRWLIFLHAQARALRGDAPKDLRQDFVKVVNANPRFVDAWGLLAWSWIGETENLEEATKVFEGAHVMLPDDQKIAENLLYYYDRTERTDDAERLMESFFRPRGLDPRGPVMEFDDPSYAAIRSQQDRSQQGQDGMQQAQIHEVGTDPTYQAIEQANLLMSQQDYEAALEIYEKLVRENPNATDFLSKRDEIRQVVSHNRFVTQYNEAVRLFGERQWLQAVELLTQLLETDMSDDHRDKAQQLLEQAKTQRGLRGDSGP